MNSQQRRFSKSFNDLYSPVSQFDDFENATALFGNPHHPHKLQPSRPSLPPPKHRQWKSTDDLNSLDKNFNNSREQFCTNPKYQSVYEYRPACFQWCCLIILYILLGVCFVLVIIHIFNPDGLSGIGLNLEHKQLIKLHENLIDQQHMAKHMEMVINLFTMICFEELNKTQTLYEAECKKIINLNVNLMQLY